MGREATDAEVQKVYDEFWQRIIAPEGEVDIELVKKELFDYHTVIGEVTKVYGHITSNRFTKPTTIAEVVIDAAEAHYQWWFSEDEPEEEEWGLQSQLGDPVWEMEKRVEKLRDLQPGQPCSLGCANHVTHPCERCGRYRAGLASGPPIPSEAWETQEGWEAKIIAEPVVFSRMAPREAKQILELVGECLSHSGYSVDLILQAIKVTPYLQRLINIAERTEVAGDTDIDCPFCGVVGDRPHQIECVVAAARTVLVQVKAALK